MLRLASLLFAALILSAAVRAQPTPDSGWIVSGDGAGNAPGLLTPTDLVASPGGFVVSGIYQRSLIAQPGLPSLDVGWGQSAFALSFGADASYRPSIVIDNDDGISADQTAEGIAADEDGNVYVAGWLNTSDQRPVEFDPLGSSTIRGNGSGNEGIDAFVASYDADGKLRYVNEFDRAGTHRTTASTTLP